MTYSTQLATTSTPLIYRFYVELISNQLDHEGITEDSKIVEILVEEFTKEAIESFIASINELQGYSIVSYWTPEVNDEF